MVLDILQWLVNLMLWIGLITVIPGVIIGTIMLVSSSKKEDGSEEKKKQGKNGAMFIFIPLTLMSLGGILFLLVSFLRAIFG